MSILFKTVKRHAVALIIALITLNTWSLPVVAETSITVKPGQSIIKVMRQVYPDQRSRWPVLMRELVQANPAAFENGDPRTLKEGSVLILPEQSTVKVKQDKRARAASVKSLSGSVALFDDKKKSQEIKQGSQIYVGDQLLTSDSGAVTLSFIDGAVVKLRCNSLLTIDQYKMRTRGSVSELSILKGSLHNETGRIGKRGADKVILKNPLGSVTTNQAEYGVRVHQMRACGQQADVESDGLYVAVLSGKVITESDGGELSLSSGDAVVVAQKEMAPVATQAYAGMVFGDKIIEELPVVKSKPLLVLKEEQSQQEDNGIPVWWMIVASVILGVTF